MLLVNQGVRVSLSFENGYVTMEPGPFDVHGHPRAFDPITDVDISGLNGYEGKAGIPAYSETALLSGIVAVSAMPNEFYRVLDDNQEDGTNLVQFPISNPDRARMMELSIGTQSRINMSYHLGVDPNEIIFGLQEFVDFKKLGFNFTRGGNRATALKIFGNISTGGNNVPIKRIPEITREWHSRYPHKPVIMHLEDDNVGVVLEQMHTELGDDIPVHIAHVSSKQELEAVIEAKQRGMNVTCEATPHHLFANAEDAAELGGFGCMKPSLKPAEDVKFLWENIQHIDIFASDCAPHKTSDKEASPPAFGVTNHTLMMPLLFGAAEEGRLSLNDIYQRVVVNPRKRFNLPMSDGTHVIFDVRAGYQTAEEAESSIAPKYGQNIFPRLEREGSQFNLFGRLVSVSSGSSWAKADDLGLLIPRFRTSLTHLKKLS